MPMAPRPGISRRVMFGALVALAALFTLAAGFSQTQAPTASAAESTRLAAKGDTPPSSPPSRAKLLEMVVLDVGQGDGILIRSPAGKVVLLDAGPKGARGAVLASLSALGVSSIDLAVGSHPHEDHIGSMATVIETLPVKRFMDPGFPHTSVTYQNLLRTLEQHQIPYGQPRRGQKIDLKGGAMLTVLAPEDPLLTGTRSDANSNSVVMRLEYGGFSAILTGDAERETERRLLRHTDDLELLRATVLKVAHHGSRHSTYADFLDTVAPNIALISLGADNNYGHPGKTTLNKLDGRGITTFRTDQVGAIRLRTDGEWIWVDGLGAPASGLSPDAPPTMASTPLGVFPAKANMVEKVIFAAAEDGSGHNEADAHAAEPVNAAASYAASRSSKVFHKADCGNAARISAQNLRTYTSREAAVEAGKRPAQCCHP